MIYLLIKNQRIYQTILYNLLNQKKTDANKVAVSSILPRKDKFNSKVKEVNAHLQDICSSL